MPCQSKSRRRLQTILKRTASTGPLRQAKPRTAWLLTRRCTKGTNFLGMNARESNRLILYCLAVGANACGLKVLALGLLNNHLHLVVWDEHGTITKFTQRFFRRTALCLKTDLGEAGIIWDGSGLDMEPLHNEHDILLAVLYVMQNPLRHRVIDELEELSEYPLFVTSIADIANQKEHRRRRPAYFSARGAFPRRPTLVFQPPPNYTVDEWVAVLEAAWDGYGDRLKRKYPGKHPRRADWNSPRQQRRQVALQESERDHVSPFVSLSATHLAAQEDYARFREDYRRAQKAQREGRPIPFPVGTVPSPQTMGAEVQVLTDEQKRARLERLRIVPPANERLYATRVPRRKAA